jgi:hypothetical protein
MENKMTPLEIFETKAHYNKWLNQLTESEKDLILEMLNEAQQESIPIEPPVKPNFADTQKEFEEKFCYSFMENGEKRINNIMWKSCDNANDVWEWFEQKLIEASKISA